MGLFTAQAWHNWLGTIWMIPYLYLIIVLLVARTEKIYCRKPLQGHWQQSLEYIYCVARIWHSIEQRKLELDYSQSNFGAPEQDRVIQGRNEWVRLPLGGGHLF